MATKKRSSTLKSAASRLSELMRPTHREGATKPRGRGARPTHIEGGMVFTENRDGSWAVNPSADKNSPEARKKTAHDVARLIHAELERKGYDASEIKWYGPGAGGYGYYRVKGAMTKGPPNEFDVFVGIYELTVHNANAGMRSFAVETFSRLMP